jgi:sialidase-1
VLVNTRHQLSAEDVTPAETAAGLRGEAIVLSDGSWASTPAYARVDNFRGPVVHGTLLAWPGSERHGDARRLLFSLPAGEHGTNAGRRHDLRMWISHDDGATWTDGVRLTGRWTAYSDVVAIDEDHVGVLFETGSNDGEFLRGVAFLRAAVQPLDDATLASWSFEDGVVDGGPFAIELGTSGELTTVDGRSPSTRAVGFDGGARLCASEAALDSAFDIGLRDDFAIEAVFRTAAHAAGGSADAGTLAGKTRTGTEPAWWLRVEDGHVRFLAAICDADALNCGVVPGECADVTACENVGLVSDAMVSDGAWHRVAVARDARSGVLRMRVDDGAPQENAWPTSKVAKNDEPFCLGAFADGERPFVGELDLVRLHSRPVR